MTATVGAMLDGECPDDELSAMVGELLGCFGAVTPTAGDVEYIWVECEPPGPRFKKVCIGSSGFHLDDGGSSPVVVEIEVLKSYPFS